jgi:SAM-dependent methyltransferase
MTGAPTNPMRNQAARNNAHYEPLFSQLKADLGPDSLRFEADCLAYELSQIPGIPESALVLDAGCGNGRYAAAWRRLFPSARVIGVDINRMILSKGLICPDALRPINGNLEALPFESGSFDIVMSRGVIQHTANPHQALKELLRVCKAGGLLYFYTYRHGWYDVVLGGARRIAGRIGTATCSRVIYGVCNSLRLDPRAPAMILDELFVPIRFAFSEQTILEWLRSSGTSLASIQPVVHAQFGNLSLPVDRRTKLLHRLLPKNGLITLAVQLQS